jgi:hypothetical protein
MPLIDANISPPSAIIAITPLIIDALILPALLPADWHALIRIDITYIRCRR